jgi:hypothetical protein
MTAETAALALAMRAQSQPGSPWLMQFPFEGSVRRRISKYAGTAVFCLTCANAAALVTETVSTPSKLDFIGSSFDFGTMSRQPYRAGRASPGHHRNWQLPRELRFQSRSVPSGQMESG